MIISRVFQDPMPNICHHKSILVKPANGLSAIFFFLHFQHHLGTLGNSTCSPFSLTRLSMSGIYSETGRIGPLSISQLVFNSCFEGTHKPQPQEFYSSPPSCFDSFFSSPPPPLLPAPFSPPSSAILVSSLWITA